jgi:hypothetical protein
MKIISLSCIIKKLTGKNMKTSKDKNPEKGKTAKEKKQSSISKEKKLSPIARYWETVDSKNWEIVDMRAVLK